MSDYTYTGNPDPRFYPLQSADNECFRFTDKDTTGCERNIIDNYWREQLNLYGQKLNYYINSTSLTAADMLYGEQPTQPFHAPIEIIAGINLNENALMLSKYGLISDDEITAFIHISTFFAKASGVSLSAEPKSGDVFSLVEYGNDRPGGRGPNFYEITQRLDQDIAQINPLAGHYVWLIKAKRFEYSFEPNIVGEQVNQQVFDDAVGPGVSGATKNYSWTVSAAASAVFDYSDTNNFDNVYGGY